MLLKERHKPRWELFVSNSLAEAAHKARDLDWEHDKVQLRERQVGVEKFEYSVEPYENCKCQNLLKFDDFFDRTE